MTPAQEEHLARIKNTFDNLVDEKYRKGQAEHGGDLFEKGALELINAGIDEAIDQVVYLLTARDKLLESIRKRVNESS